MGTSVIVGTGFQSISKKPQFRVEALAYKTLSCLGQGYRRMFSYFILIPTHTYLPTQTLGSSWNDHLLMSLPSKMLQVKGPFQWWLHDRSQRESSSTYFLAFSVSSRLLTFIFQGFLNSYFLNLKYVQFISWLYFIVYHLNLCFLMLL